MDCRKKLDSCVSSATRAVHLPVRTLRHIPHTSVQVGSMCLYACSMTQECKQLVDPNCYLAVNGEYAYNGAIRTNQLNDKTELSLTAFYDAFSIVNRAIYLADCYLFPMSPPVRSQDFTFFNFPDWLVVQLTFYKVIIKQLTFSFWTQFYIERERIAFRDVTTCSLVDTRQRFEGRWWLRFVSCRSLRNVGISQPTKCHNSEDNNLLSHRRKDQSRALLL
jgi:hypothetical protein